MSAIKDIINETKEVMEFRGLIEVYEEIAAGKMRKVKKNIIISRDFYEGLGRLSIEVGSDFNSALEKEKPEEAIVFVSANAGLYGDIIEQTFKAFFDYIREHKGKLFVVGKIGVHLMHQYAKSFDFEEMEFPDDKVENLPIADIIGKLINFRKITVFYGKFHNLVIQKPNVSTFSGSLFPQTVDELKLLAKKRMTYLYEPTVYSVSDLFTKEIASGILEQMLLESQLSKLASRVMHLDRAIDKTRENLQKLALKKRKAKKQMLEKKQNTTMAGIIVRSYA